jgi:hypothetical protein
MRMGQRELMELTVSEVTVKWTRANPLARAGSAGRGSSAPENLNTRQTYDYLQPHHLHRYSTFTLLACLVSHFLPLFFNLRNESAKVQCVASSNGRGTLLYPVYAYQLSE